MTKEEQSSKKGIFEIIEFKGKILTVKRRCSCGGDVEIKVDNEAGTKTATCTSCGNTLIWNIK